MFSGRRDRFNQDIIDLITRVEEKTKDRDGMILNICFDYGSYHEIIGAVKEIASDVQSGKVAVNAIDEDMISNHLYTKDLPKLDLLIRTSGEQRISNFLLWQIAYAEFYFAKVHWPAFNEKELYKAIDDFQKRNRRFGGLKGAKK
jgi:undecaprenyl diphosphate synthase